MELQSLFTTSISLFTLAGNLVTLGLVIFFVVRPSIYRRIVDIFEQHALLIGVFISGASTIGSLIYSEVVGYPACILCWMQRLFMYPIFFILLLALWRRERPILPYALFLSVLGGAVAFYQWTKDMLAMYSSITIPCPAVTSLPSCDKIYVFEYHYISIAMFALNAFILIGFTMYSGMQRDKRPS